MALNRVGKILYSILFLVLVPAALVAWATATSAAIPLRLQPSPIFGAPCTLAGLLLLLFGMKDLWVHGGGLPMNAAPPPRYVSRGAYAIVPHPIYTGFCMLCAGISITVGSSSGLWLVTPVVMLACTALVLGYERHDLTERFGDSVRGLLPSIDESRPSAFDRARCLILVIPPWLALYGAVRLLGRSPITLPAHPALSPKSIATWLCASSFAALALTPLVLRTRQELRTVTLRSLLALAFGCMLFVGAPICIDVVALFIPPTAHSSAWLRHLSATTTSRQQVDAFFPSFIVMYASLIASLADAWRAVFRGVVCVWAALICACYLIPLHGNILPLAEALIAVVLAVASPHLWQAMRSASERIANSWQEWHVGPVRIISHGMYVGLGGFIALAIGGILAGPGHEIAIAIAALLAVIGAALWAQFVEGSPQMLRPFGFYGGLLGGIVGALIAPLFHTNIWLLLAVFSTIGSFGQALGRLRCLVQGCCHGKPSSAHVGIRYTHPSSRVCRFTNWTGLPLHPTPLYSLLWNVVVALIVVRLWTLHANLTLITGLYFILNGVGRFVEESFRGEPQTRIVAGLRLYQWAAVASLIVGALFTALPRTSQQAPGLTLRWSVLVPALVFGVVVGCAMGVDFPQSQRRFSRLT